MSKESKETKLWLLLTALVCVPILAPPIIAGDYFWHVVTGQYILDRGALPAQDIFQAIADDRPWGTFQWLYEVLLALGEPNIGHKGIRVFHGLFGALFLFLWIDALGKHLRWGKEASLLVLGLLLFLYADRVRIRPHVFTFLIIGVWLPYLLAPRKISGATCFMVLAGMCGMLANLHAGGALILLCLIFASFVGYSVQIERKAAALKKLWGLFLVSLLLCALMPGFLGGIAHATRMAEANTQLFLEWQAPIIYFDQPATGFLERIHHWILGGLPYLLALVYALLACLLLVRKGLGALRALDGLASIAFAGAVLFLSMRSVRFVPFVVLAIPGLFALFHAIFQGWNLRFPKEGILRWLKVVFAFLLILGSHVYLLRAYRSGNESIGHAAQRWLEEDIPQRFFPVALAEFMKQERVSGGIYNVNTKWGSYLLWKSWPEVRVHYDGRGNLGQVAGCDDGGALPCSEAGRIAFLQQHRSDPAYRDACLKILLDATDQPGVSHILMPAPTFAQVYPRKSPDEEERFWPPPQEFKRIYPPEGASVKPGSPELWFRVRD